MYKQIIIVRKDLNMSVGKLAAQVAHGSMAFFTSCLKAEKEFILQYNEANTEILHMVWDYPQNSVFIPYALEQDIFENWICDSFTKCVLEAKNKNQLLKAKTMAEELGMEEGKDFFMIYDACNTELKPEFVDENGIGRTLTCIGFKPMDSEIIDKIGKKYQLYK